MAKIKTVTAVAKISALMGDGYVILLWRFPRLDRFMDGDTVIEVSEEDQAWRALVPSISLIGQN